MRITFTDEEVRELLEILHDADACTDVEVALHTRYIKKLERAIKTSDASIIYSKKGSIDFAAWKKRSTEQAENSAKVLRLYSESKKEEEGA